MYSEKIGSSMQFNLKHVGTNNFLNHESFQKVTSPFSRMYLVLTGTGQLMTSEGTRSLLEDRMYLIPSYTTCSYFFHPGLQMIYVHFALTMKDGLDVFNLLTCHSEINATDFMKFLFKRLNEINPNREIPHHDPEVYQNKPWNNETICYESLKHHLETTSLLGQLLSNFIQVENSISPAKLFRYKLQPILHYIRTHLDQEISVENLAAMACLSTDHFSRTFKSILGMCPNEYIIAKRIEKAQALLLTTDLSQAEIMEEAGIKNISYFTRIFKKHTKLTPSEFRKMHW
ncbi:MAG: helix-turn-helix transcriptional regulator [Lunatimonas sp.]|uniref:AraC family transcriptional regulator n=1 Tax=Lunatimonas sp. TaxID=2060141 RepID=UPI00263B512B|nr:AraC family transcriptional regulator [Lunatimonas sp.]MCC5937917.1 helix-turn-helix transcriptional regulator [Lunatimonas sp.]